MVRQRLDPPFILAAYLIFGCSPSGIAVVTSIAVVASVVIDNVIIDNVVIDNVVSAVGTIISATVGTTVSATIETSVNSRTADNSTSWSSNGASTVVADEINVAVLVEGSRSGRAGMGVGDVVTTEVISLITVVLAILNDLVLRVLVDGLPDGGVAVADGKASILGVFVVDFL